ncbi:MAG: hypothetical protein ACYCUV_07455 [Phycisphaerae bacterium]
MKWWQASLAVVRYYLAFAVIAVGWHRYIATDLPLAAMMRHAYLDTNRFGYLMFYGFPDTLFPMAILGFGVGVIGRRQRRLFRDYPRVVGRSGGSNPDAVIHALVTSSSPTK